MGQASSIYNKQGGFNIYPYPYSLTQKFFQFPHKFMLTHCNTWVHQLTYACMTSVVMWTVGKNIGSPEVMQWVRNRKQNKLDHPHYHWAIQPLKPDYNKYDLDKFKGMKRWRAD